MGRAEDGRVLEALRKIDVAGTKRVEAGDFENVLQKAGVPLGSASADEIVLQCKVENDGRINYAPLEEAVARTGPQPSPPKEARPAAPAAPRTPPPVPVNVKVSAPVTRVPASGLDDPKERVHKAVDALHHAFSQYDNGKISLGTLQGTIRELGLVETPSYHSLIRHGALDMTFAQLFQALLLVERSPGAQERFASDPAVPQRATRYGATIPRSTDVVTWRGSAVRARAPVSPRAQESVNSPWHTVENDRDPFAPHVYVAEPSKVAAHPSRRRFEPGMMEALSSHIVFNDVPEAHALSAEKETLKENIYQCIRHLDQGLLTAEAFARRIRQLGVEMPAEVRTLLEHARLDGTVIFREFALAFEPVFRPWLAPAGAVPRSPPPSVIAAPPAPPAQGQQPPATMTTEAPPPPAPHSPFRGSPTGLTSRAQASHGDLISWSQAPNVLEATEIGAQRSGRRYEHSYDAHHLDHVDLTWNTEPRQSEYASGVPPTHAYSRRTYAKDAHNKPTLEMLAWDVTEKK